MFSIFLILLKTDLRATLVLFHTHKHIHSEQGKRQFEFDTCSRRLWGGGFQANLGSTRPPGSSGLIFSPSNNLP